MDLRKLWKGNAIDDAREWTLALACSLCNRVGEGMQEVDIPTVISKQYVG
jgi:hypothetical protein